MVVEGICGHLAEAAEEYRALSWRTKTRVVSLGTCGLLAEAARKRPVYAGPIWEEPSGNPLYFSGGVAGRVKR